MTSTPPGDGAAAPCRCGHARELHQHDRPGTDCGIGGPAHCATFRHAQPVLRRLLSRILRPASVDGGDVALAPVHTLGAARAARTARAQVSAATMTRPAEHDLPRLAP